MPNKKSSRGNHRHLCQDLPLPKNKLDLFYSHICSRSKTTAKRLLSNISDDNPRLEWTEGYLIALEGMVLSLKDQHSFLNKVSNNGINKKYLLELHGQFETRTQSPLSHAYDQGYFSAWMDLFQTINNLPE